MALQQDIRFCTTPDGVRLATAASGSGPPLVVAANWLSNLERDAVEDDWVRRLGALGRRNTVVRYDSRGCGLSDRQPPAITFELQVQDLEAVVEARGLDRFSILGASAGAAVAVAYAARHPERVDRLVVLSGFASSYFSSKRATPEVRAEAELLLENARVGWNNPKSAFRRVFIAQVLGDAPPQAQRALDERMRDTMSTDAAVHHLRCNYGIDVKAECAQVRCPTLVFHGRGDEMIGFEQGRKLAAAVAGARFVPLDFTAHHLHWDMPAARVFEQELASFLHPDLAPAAAHLTQRQRQVLLAVAAGRTDKQIARALDLSPRTVEMHVAGALKALDCATRAEAVAKASSAGLLGG